MSLIYFPSLFYHFQISFKSLPFAEFFSGRNLAQSLANSNKRDVSKITDTFLFVLFLKILENTSHFYEASATVKMYSVTVVRQSWYIKLEKKNPYRGFVKTRLTYTFGVCFWVFGGWSLRTPKVFCWWLRDQSRSPAHHVGWDLPFFTSH